jgi:hypothetical protein
MKSPFIAFAFLILCQVVWGQQDSILVIDSTKYVRFFKVEKLDDVEELDFRAKDTIPKEFKEKRPKRRVYYGYKSKRGYIKSGSGTGVTIVVFHYVKKWQEPDNYVNEIYWFDPIKMKIMENRKYDPLTSKLLHGPYKKIFNGEIIEQGIYYLGTKHGRWMELDKARNYDFRTGDKDKRKEDEEGNKITIQGSDTTIKYQLLESKVKYSKGWPKYNKFVYYDYEKTKLKEVIPYDDNGNKTGEYFSYFEDGHINEHGFYFKGTKVDLWVTYHVLHSKVRREKEVLYPALPTEKNPKGELQKLWDDKGELVFDLKEKIDTRPKEKSANETTPK